MELWNMEFCSIQYIWILQYLQYIFYSYLSSMLVSITAYKTEKLGTLELPAGAVQLSVNSRIPFNVR